MSKTTKHERILLVGLAYVIGFTAAFIAFGIASYDKFQEAQTGAQHVSVDQKEQVRHAITSVGFGVDGLYAITAIRERMLSANRSAFAASVIESLGMSSGLYYHIVAAEASRNGDFVYFCEQLSKDNEHCDPYIYVLAEDVLYPVVRDGEPYQVPIPGHQSQWTRDNLLMLNGAVSASAEEPWNITSGAQQE